MGARAPTLIVQRHVDEIIVPADRRPINEESMGPLIDSISTIGLQTPITIRVTDEGHVLITGAHRLEAFKRLGISHVPTLEFHGTKTEAEIWEIDENLRRAELTEQERDKQIAARARLTKKRTKEQAEAEKAEREEAAQERERKRAAEAMRKKRGTKTNGSSYGDSGQHDQKPRNTDDDEPAAKPGRPEDGTARAAREMGIDRAKVRRAEKVASLQPDADALVAELGLANNENVMLRAAEAGWAVARAKGLTNQQIHETIDAFYDEGVSDPKQEAILRAMDAAQVAELQKIVAEREARAEARKAPKETEAPASPAEAATRADRALREFEEAFALVPVEYWRNASRHDREGFQRRFNDVADGVHRVFLAV